MSLMQKITEICHAHPEGIDVEQIARQCPEASRKQVIAAARNAYTRGRVNRIAKGGLGAAAAMRPAVYGPALPGQKPLECVTANLDPEYKRTTRARVPLNTRKPISSVWDLAP